jgi:hypothetical protein
MVASSASSVDMSGRPDRRQPDAVFATVKTCYRKFRYRRPRGQAVRAPAAVLAAVNAKPFERPSGRH